MEWLYQHTEMIAAVFGGLIAIIGAFVKVIFDRKKNDQEINNNNSNNNNINIVNDIKVGEVSTRDISKESHDTVDKSIQILFVDDQKFDIVDVLKKAGWINTKRIKDITDLDATDVKNSDVIFVDVNGVGCKLFPKDQGLGLAEAIKKKYPEKYIVLYSAVSHNFHKALNIVDSILEKNAEPYEFINILENSINNENTNRRR